MLKLSFQNQSYFLILMSLWGAPLSNLCIYQSLSFVRAEKRKGKIKFIPLPSENRMKD